MKHTRSLAALAAAFLSFSTAAAQPFETGLQRLMIPDTAGDRHLEGFLWYPTDETKGHEMAHGNAVWESVPVIPDAEPVAGRKPLLVLSHGMYGNARNQAWLAQVLTREGYIVAAIDHPGTSTFQRDPEHRRELWRRPEDISRTIDHLLGDHDLGSLIDAGRIFMAGHSLGGFTAIALAGGRYDPDRVDANCATDPDEIICEIFTSWGIAKAPEDRIEMAKDLSDPRVAAFAVFDLGGTQTFAPSSLAAIDRPMLVFGAPHGSNGLDLDTESRALVAALPKERTLYIELERLEHFDFLGVCTDDALEILRKEEPDDVFVCEDGTGERRAEHAEIASEVLKFFEGVSGR